MRIVWLSALILSACSSSVPAADATPRFDVLQFFSGATRGEGRLKILFKDARSVQVQGQGIVEGRTLVLRQRIAEAGKAPRERAWRITETGSGRYEGTLTDARGPVTASVEGNRLHIQFTMPNRMRVEQWLTLEPDGRTAQNKLTVSRFGVQVARLDEVIRKVG